MTFFRLASLSLLATSALVGCSSSSSPNSTTNPSDASTDATVGDDGADAAIDTGVDAGPVDNGVHPETPAEVALVAARPYQSHKPAGYDPAKPTPMILLLHGYGATGVLEFQYFEFSKMAEAQTLFVAYPDGTEDNTNNRYWHATDGCCGPADSTVDDVAYLTAVVHDMQAKNNIDPKRIWLVGHSNGGFMTHRLGCERSELFAAAVSLAGMQYLDYQAKCMPTRPFPIAQVHGTADMTIPYDGGSTTGYPMAYPSAPETVADWAALDNCTSALTDTGTTIDVDAKIAGNETTVSKYSGCAGAGAVELWTIQGGAHAPTLDGTWGTDVYGFLSAHVLP